MLAFRDLIAEVPAPSNDCVDISSDMRLGMPAFHDLIAEVPAPSNDCVDISSDMRLGRADERWLNAWYERVQFSKISLDSVPLWFEEPCRDTR